MAIKLNSNFDYRGSNPNFERDVVETLEELKNLSGYPDGHLVYCKETKLHYKYNEELESGETGKFEEFKTGGVAIVDSVDKLDPNAEQGSLASVAVNTISEVSFSELYQPTEEDFSSDILLPIAKLSKVSRISVIVPDPSIESPEFEINLYSEDVNPENGVGSGVFLTAGIAVLFNMADESQTVFELLIYNEEANTLTLNEENLAELNSILSEKVYVYGGTWGPLNEDGNYGLIDPSISDTFYRAIGEVKKSDLYIKDFEGWKVVGDKKLKAEVNNLQTIVDNLENTVNNLEDKTDLIVNSVDELPEEAPIGSSGNVVSKKTKLVSIFDYPISQIEVINSKNYSWPLAQTVYFTVLLRNGERHHIVYDTSTNTLWRGQSSSLKVAKIATFNIDNESKTLQITSINQEELDFFKEKAKGHTISEFSHSKELVKVFFNQFLVQPQDFDSTTLYVKNTAGWEQYSELADQSVTTEKISNSSVTLEKLSTDVQDKFTAIESQLTSKSTSIDFGANEDTTTLAIMDPSVITKIKVMNVSNLYISYGDVVKQEIDLSLSEQNIDLGDADFIVINITRTTDEIDAALGLTFINKTV